MGAGDYPAGIGPAGFDPVQSPSQRLVLYAPPSLYFDLSTRSFPYDARGALVGVHPVDQEVELALGITAGSLGSAPAQGHTLRFITSPSAPDAERQVEDRVNRALARLLERGDITVRSARFVRPAPPGRLLVAVEYVNLRLKPPALRRIQRPL
jgi:hypothetical protein